MVRASNTCVLLAQPFNTEVLSGPIVLFPFPSLYLVSVSCFCVLFLCCHFTGSVSVSCFCGLFLLCVSVSCLCVCVGISRVCAAFWRVNTQMQKVRENLGSGDLGGVVHAATSTTKIRRLGPATPKCCWPNRYTFSLRFCSRYQGFRQLFLFLLLPVDLRLEVLFPFPLVRLRLVFVVYALKLGASTHKTRKV
jgi:hypothetical protein